MTPEQLATGTILADQYEITGVLGVGGFATVYQATQLNIGRTVAIKLLNSNLDESSEEENVTRFMREARAVAQIDHPGVVTVHDVGVLPPRRPYIVMQPFNGSDLAKALDTSGPLKPARFLPLFIDCLDALAVAHDLGIVHRDLKPENLILIEDRREALKIIDFGIVRLDQDKVHLTRTGRRIGTPRYLAPEYIKDAQVSPALDVYQMGLSLVEALTAKRVVTSRNPLDAALVHLSGDLNIPRGLLTGPLGPILHQALARDVTKRYPDAAAMRDALEAIDPATISVGDANDLLSLKAYVPPATTKATAVGTDLHTDPTVPVSVAAAKKVLAGHDATVQMEPEEVSGRVEVGQKGIDSEAATIQMSTKEAHRALNSNRDRAETMASFDASRQVLDAVTMAMPAGQIGQKQTPEQVKVPTPATPSAEPKPQPPPKIAKSPPRRQNSNGSTSLLMFAGGGLLMGVVVLMVLIVVWPSDAPKPTPEPAISLGVDAGVDVLAVDASPRETEPAREASADTSLAPDVPQETNDADEQPANEPSNEDTGSADTKDPNEKAPREKTRPTKKKPNPFGKW